MDEVILTRQLRQRGLGADEVAGMVARGELERLRRGGYVVPAPDARTREEHHQLLIAATLPRLHAGAVLSHGSAALLHGLPLWPSAIDRVHVTRDRPHGGRRGKFVHVHDAPLEPAELVQVGGRRLTSLARTVVDLGRSLPPEQGVAAADHARRAGLSRQDHDQAVRRATRWPGVRGARRAAALASPLAESAGESASRVKILWAGLPPPKLQFEVRTPSGQLVGRSDFGWEEYGTLGEFDGRVKYGRLLDGKQASLTVEEIVYREKLREDALRDLGWQVVRWTWSDLAAFEEVVRRLHRAFARAGHPLDSAPR